MSPPPPGPRVAFSGKPRPWDCSSVKVGRKEMFPSAGIGYLRVFGGFSLISVRECGKGVGGLVCWVRVQHSGVEKAYEVIMAFSSSQCQETWLWARVPIRVSEGCSLSCPFSTWKASRTCLGES